MLLSARNDQLCLLGGTLSPRRALGGSSQGLGAAAVAPSLLMSGKAVSAHRDITALFSLLSPIPLFLLLLFSLNVSTFFFPFFFFFPLILFVGFDMLSFFSLCPLPFSSSLFGLLSLSACCTPPFLGKALV